MTTNNSRGPSVQVTENSTFALELADYLNQARAPLSVRAFAEKASAGSKSHWAQIFSHYKVMTTNDIKVAADVLGMNPYDFVEQARRHAGHNVVPFPNVVPTEDDYQQSDFPTVKPAAAETERNAGDE